MTTPLFSVGDTVYLKESAQAGFLEAVRVSHVMTSTNDQWVYNVVIGSKLPTPPTFGERITHQHPNVLYFNETELVSFCDAADILEEVLTQRLADIQAQRDNKC